MAQINDFLSLIDLQIIRDYCLAKGERVSYAKGESVVKAGHVCPTVGLVLSGYFKYCADSDAGESHVTGFSFKNEFAMDFVNSFLTGRPSKVSIVAGCNAELLIVSTAQLRDHIDSVSPALISHASAVLLDEAYCRYLNLYRKSPAERYRELVMKYPDVVQQTSLRDIASYLRVTPTHLSRIRRKL